jgi:hypothetical protein
MIKGDLLTNVFVAIFSLSPCIKISNVDLMLLRKATGQLFSTSLYLNAISERGVYIIHYTVRRR